MIKCQSHISPPPRFQLALRLQNGGVYAPSSSATPRCWHRNIILQTDRSCLCFSRPPEIRQSKSTERGWPQCRRRSTMWVCPFNVLWHWHHLWTHLWSVVKSLAVLWTLALFLHCIPLHHGDLELDSVGDLMNWRSCVHFGSMAMVGGLICETKIPVQELWLKM